MGKIATDTATLKVTCHQGLIWYLRGDGMPANSRQSVYDFMSSQTLADADTVRVAGTSGNANLLVELYEQRLRGRFSSLQVGSPLCCESADGRRDPEVLLFAMRRFSLPPSLGGWHEFNLKDYSSYLMAAELLRHKHVTDLMRQNLRGHPTWPSLSFVEGIDVDACCLLISVILDPRWYVDTNGNPNSGSRLEQYLGLSPKTQAAVARGDKSWRADHCQIVMNCWRRQSDPISVSMSSRSFLWRTWAEKGKGVKGDLAASKHFIAFLRLTWIQAMSEGPQMPYLFVPNYFFDSRRPDETTAYIKHVMGLD
jgi:hypothetical protein